MINKIKAALIILFVPAIILLGSCQKQKAEWKVTIEEENGVKVIKNPEEPMYGEIELELEMDLSIGGENAGENYNFSYIRDIDVDGEGNIYVVDTGQYRIQKYDKNGNYLKTIGRIFLQKPKSVLHEEIDNYFDLFNQEGYYLYKIKIHEISPDIIKKGFAYTFKANPDTGYYKIERFRIKNWDKIKTGL